MNALRKQPSFRKYTIDQPRAPFQANISSKRQNNEGGVEGGMLKAQM